MGRGRKRKADADEPPPPPSLRVLRSGKKFETDSQVDQSEPETREKSKSKPTLKAVRRNRGRYQNSDPNNETTSSSFSFGNPPGSPDSFDELQPETNPLLIPVVVKHLFEVWARNVNTLKTARLVCKTWFEATRPLWRSTAVLTLVPDDEEHTGRGLKISDFMDIHANMDISISRFCLNSWIITNNEWDPSPEFWDILRPIVKDMRLKKCEFRLESIYKFSLSHRSLLTLIFENLPELENLIVDRCLFFGGKLNLKGPEKYGFRTQDVERHMRGRFRCSKSEYMNLTNGAAPESHRNLRTLEVIGQLPFFWKPFLRLFPNLETIRSRADNSGDYNCLTTAIKTLRQENRKSLNIQHLDLMSTLAFRLDERGLERLNGCNLNLQSLCIEIGNFEHQIPKRICRNYISDDNARGLIKDMLAPQKDTLKVLKLFRIASSGYGPFHNFSFGDNLTLNNLNEVHLYGPITDSFEFLRNVPNLRKLVINQKCKENWNNLPQFKISCANEFQGDMVENTRATLLNYLEFTAPLNRLIFLHVDLGFPPKSLETLAKATPNLTTLHTILNNASLITAAKKWRNLQELKLLLGSQVDDDGVIELAQNSQNLKIFVLQTYCGDESLGDRSVEGAFLKMEELHTLQICASRKMTKNGEALLKENIQEVVVHRNYEIGRCADENYCSHRFIIHRGSDSDDPLDSDFE